MSAGKIQSELNDDGKQLWASRSIKDHVVLMDWNSTFPADIKPTILILKSILLEVRQRSVHKPCRLCIINFSLNSGIKMLHTKIQYLS